MLKTTKRTRQKTRELRSIGVGRWLMCTAVKARPVVVCCRSERISFGCSRKKKTCLILEELLKRVGMDGRTTSPCGWLVGILLYGERSLRKSSKEAVNVISGAPFLEAFRYKYHNPTPQGQTTIEIVCMLLSNLVNTADS